MPKKIVHHTVILHREGKRIQPQIGKAFDFTDAEHDSILGANPRALKPLKQVEDDANSQPHPFDKDGDGNPDVDLSTLKKDELLALAAERGVDVAPTATKAQIIDAIESGGL